MLTSRLVSLLLCSIGATAIAACTTEVIRTAPGTSNLDGDSASGEQEQPSSDAGPREPTAVQRAQAAELASMLDFMRERTAWHSAIDWEALRLLGEQKIFAGDESEKTYFGALFSAFIAVPQGHQGLYMAEGCGTIAPYPSISQRGVCGRPHSAGIVVTNARPSNKLGLKKGDLITKLGKASGAAIVESLAERPICATSRPSTSFRDAVVATSFADLLEAGDEVEIQAPDGTKRTLTFPSDMPLTGTFGDALACQDPFGRKTNVAVESEIRASDGVGVIRLPGFTDAEQTWPANPTLEEIEAYRDKFEAKIKVAFDKVKSAPAIVWDIRGNGGGMTMVGLSIASGFPGAVATPISYCQQRIEKSDPPAFDEFKYAEYALTPGGQFAYAGKVAILIDGLDYSAADYFPLAVKTRTNALVLGAPTAGGYGAVSASKELDGPPSFAVSVDMNRCSSAEDDQPLEGKSVTPHIAVDYSPQDLAADKDSILERAAAALLD